MNPSLTPKERPDPDFIRSLFSSISENYDTANDAMTFGLARLWRKRLVKWSEAKRGDSVLDCATGTGDLALEFKRAVGPKGRVVGSDFCADMLKFAPNKANRKKLHVDFEQADVLALPYKNGEFDIASIAYGIRNVADPMRAFQEMARVVKPSGKVMILETGSVQSPVMKPFIELYFQKIVPKVGGFITGHTTAYDYLNRSSAHFPAGQEFVDWLMKSGAFTTCEWRPLLGGASHLYKATVK